jgi:ribose/xylose/arabinose/galactoside ABC-type transport system permease subunit
MTIDQAHVTGAVERFGRYRTSLEWRLRERAVQKTAINLIALVVLCAVAAHQSDKFLTSGNVLNLLQQISIVVIIGCPFTLLMVAGAFDLSVGGVAALSGSCAALLAQNGVSVPAAFAAATSVGVLVGAVNATLVVFIGINSFIATIGTMYVSRGVADLLTGGVSVTGLPNGYADLGNETWHSIPVVVLIMFLAMIIFTVIQRSTLLGRYSIAAGSNAAASYLSGVPVRGTRTICFLLTGAAAAFAGVLVSSQLNAGLPDASVGLEFAVIVAAVVGGISLFGGEGSVAGTFLGALIIGVVNNGLDLALVQSYWQTVALGCILCLAVGVDMLLQQRAEFAGLVRSVLAPRRAWRARSARAWKPESFATDGSDPPKNEVDKLG